MTNRVVRMAELTIDPAALASYRDLLACEIEASVRHEPGVLMLHAVAEADRPDHIRILEVYLDRDAYEAHLQAPHFLRYKAETAGMVLSLRLMDVDPIAMAAK